MLKLIKKVENFNEHYLRKLNKDDNDHYILKIYDSSDETLCWSETHVLYDDHNNETYAVRIDQDGGEKLLWCEDGLVF